MSSVVGITRSISACKRCRKKKIKCSQDFPRCQNCEKANAECVSLDSATGREIPRSYVVHLEERIKELEKMLTNNNSGESVETLKFSQLNSQIPKGNRNGNNHPSPLGASDYYPYNTRSERSTSSNYQGDVLSFSKLMFAAVHFNDDQKELRRLSSSGVSVKPHIDPTSNFTLSFSNKVAILPPKQQSLDFISLYFAQSNSQLPIFHRDEFIRNYFIPIYGSVPEGTNLASSSISIDWSKFPQVDEQDTWYYQYTKLLDEKTKENPEMDPFRFSASIEVPKKFSKPLYFINMVFALATSVWHLQFPDQISENYKNAALLYIEDAYSGSNRLDALQAMLCLTLYSLMRPCVPGVWYLLGSSLRLCVDLGLHVDSTSKDAFTIDMRRRLFWCCYSLDRQICVYLGRPFGIPEESIRVTYPSLLDDHYILPGSTYEELYANVNLRYPSYKHVSLAMFEIRTIQAEIQCILYDNRDVPRIYPNLQAWHSDINKKLEKWRSTTPKNDGLMNCDFNTDFFELNYHHSKLMLFGLSPNRCILTDSDQIEVAEASKGTILTYYNLFVKGALNYTWAVTQNVFMAQMSFFYAIFNCDFVRNSTRLGEIEKYTFYSNTIMKGLTEKCNAAAECSEVLTIISKAVIRLKYPSESSEEILRAPEMQKIPTEEQIQTLQPGGHITDNMRRLIVSIPELINQEDTNSGDQKRRKKCQTPRSDPNLDGSRSDEFDLDNFFDIVKKIQSPDSAMLLDQMSNCYEPVSDIQRIHSTEGNRPFTTKHLGTTHPLLYQSTVDVSRSSCYPTPMPITSYPDSASINPNIMNNIYANSKREVKEGQKVYRMMLETGADSIWDQFFAQTFKIEDEE